jgi:hypothetical protein
VHGPESRSALHRRHLGRGHNHSGPVVVEKSELKKSLAVFKHYVQGVVDLPFCFWSYAHGDYVHINQDSDRR